MTAPLPTHLRPFAVPREGIGEAHRVEADIRCPCGETRFELRYPGVTSDWEGRQGPCDAQIGDHYFFRLEARCLGCGCDHLLLDKDFHGWDGLVCHDPAQAALPRPPLVAWTCVECAGTSHTGMVAIAVESRESTLEDAGDDLDPERWYDAFGWFSLDLVCSQCGRAEPDLVSYETM